MKRLIIFLLLFAALKVAGQTTGYLRFDTVKIMKQNGTCELYIINKTKDSLGLLTNVGGGLTEFKKPRVLNDSTIIVGNDTLIITGISTLTNNKLDSTHIYVASGTDPDTLYEYKAGDSALVGVIYKGTLTAINLDTTRNATSATITNDAGDDAVIPLVDVGSDKAGLISPSDKIKVNRWEPFKSFTELRTFTNLDTSVIYTDSKQNRFRYDPDDASSADDSATVIVTSGGGRLKRIFDGIYRPEDFGAKGDGTTDDWWAFQKMFNYINTSTAGGSVWLDSRANYKIDTNQIIALPQLSDRKILHIYGNGAKITGKRVFQRRPPNQSAAASTWQGVAVVISNVQFVGSGGVADSSAVAVDLGATYGAVVEKCTFTGFDTCIAFRFGLNSTTRQNILAPKKVGIYFGYGGVWGGGLTTSQSNGSVSDQDRIYGTVAGGIDKTESGIVIEAASDCWIRNAIVEGNPMKYGIFYDYRGTTTVKGFTVEGAHIEFAPLGPKRAAFYIRGDGQFNIRNVYVQECDTFLVSADAVAREIYIENIPFLPGGSLFAAEGAQHAFYFRGMPSTFTPTSTFFVNTSPYTLPPATLFNHAIVQFNRNFQIKDTSSSPIGITVAAMAAEGLRVLGGRLAFGTDNTFDIGALAANRPRDLYLGRRLRLADTQIEQLAAGYILTNGTGGLKLFSGTTAQRPTSSPTGTIRYNTDTGAMEFRDASVWQTIASRSWVQSNFTASANNANAGSGFRWLKPATQEIKTFFVSPTLVLDSTTNADGLTLFADTTTYLATKTDISSFVTTNIYTADGTLSGNRTVTMSANTLNFSGGNVGINSAGPDKKLDILDAAAAQLRLTHTDNEHFSDFQTDGSGVLYITPSGQSVQIKAGGSIEYAAAGGVIADFYTDVQNSGTGETDLYTKSIAANTLDAVGDKLDFEFSGVSGAATNAYKVKIGTLDIVDVSGIVNTTTSAWRIVGKIIRVDATNVRFEYIFTDGETGTVLSSPVNAAYPTGFTSAQDLKLTGTSTVTTTITARTGVVKWFGAAIIGS